MPFVSSKPLLQAAQQGGYAVGAFNAENLEMIQAIVQGGEAAGCPLIIQTTPSTLRYASPELFCAMVGAVAEKAAIPVALHLDHGDSLALAARALRAGYTSIMIDGSKLPLEENIRLTKSVVDICQPCGVPVEGELGQVGGKEDDTTGAADGYTKPEEAVRFAAETGVSSLAIGVGTAHGFYETPPVLKTPLVSEIRQKVAAPLVLHGASGLSEESVRDCITRGICKVNFATELRACYTEAVKRHLAENPKAFDPKKYGAEAREAVAELVRQKCLLCRPA